MSRIPLHAPRIRATAGAARPGGLIAVTAVTVGMLLAAGCTSSAPRSTGQGKALGSGVVWFP